MIVLTIEKRVQTVWNAADLIALVNNDPLIKKMTPTNSQICTLLAATTIL